MLVVDRYVGVDPRFQSNARKARTRRSERRSPERAGTLADQRDDVPDLENPLFDDSQPIEGIVLIANPLGYGNPLPPLDLEPLEEIFPDTPLPPFVWEQGLAEAEPSTVRIGGEKEAATALAGDAALTEDVFENEVITGDEAVTGKNMPAEGEASLGNAMTVGNDAFFRNEPALSGNASLAPDLRAERETLVDLLAEYDLTLRSLHRQGGRFLAETDRGPLRVEFLEGEKALQRGRNITAALKHLREKGFTQCPEPRVSKYGERVIPWGDRAYYLYNKLPGRSAKLDASRDLQEAGRSLALLHRGGRGFQPVEPSVAAPLDIPGQFAWGRQVAADWLATVGRQRFFSDSDHLLRENLPKLTERGEKGFAWMEAAYQEKRRQTEQEGALCHGDYGAASLLKTQQTFWVDRFNHCRCDIPVTELAQFISNIVRSSRDGWKEAIYVVEGYESVEKLNEADWRILLGCLIIPFDLFEHLEGKIRTEPANTIEIIPDRKLQDQGFRRTRRTIETCNRAYAAAYRLAAQAELALPI
ncbi:hypothetical protein HM1_0332 [Heliomicrobium modesticaldum Ice1]|uniref:Aminoglycoside phosphotransferase domain-containing protein n=1 Tax=Heliobacterium modesticaldum (strain ATCC 51547 / Ice1) TaxID=498761 RepID=B0TEN2_HELMI|nr:phosphotransferase [Heliomicrobium modesticaldum]ABZ82951.1 hypothetical protein HM1_0332 [Heliomicrobium modesticaldum Ice1]